MKPLKSHELGTALISFALLIAAAQGCNDSNDNAKPPDVNAGGTKSSAGEGGEPSSSGKSSTNGGSSNTAGSTNTSGTSNQGGAGNEGGGGRPGNGTSGEAGAAGAGGAPPIPECTLPEHGANNCFNCPKAPVEWLNRCSDSTCEPFANKDRLPLLKADGTVPALPN